MLEKIQKPNDIKKIPADQLPALAEESTLPFELSIIGLRCLFTSSMGAGGRELESRHSDRKKSHDETSQYEHLSWLFLLLFP